MKIAYDPVGNYKFALEFDFKWDLVEFCRYLKNKVGYQNFNFYQKKWRFTDPRISQLIKSRYPEVSIPEELKIEIRKEELKQEADKIIVEQGNELKKKTTSNLVVKGLKGTLYPFQLIGVEFLINNNGRAILADQMGMGKTITSLAYIVHEKLEKTLVICPSSVKYNWAKETEEWTHLKPFVFDSLFFRSESLQHVVNTVKQHDIFIINFDILKHFLEVYGDIRFDCLIIDECTYIKSSSTIRSKITKFISKKIPHIILLSGTPMLNRPLELFNPLQILDPQTWRNWKQYTIDFCQGHQGTWGWDARGASNLPELQNKISRYFLRRKKEEVLTELPPKQFIDIPIEINGEYKFKYDLAISSFKDYLLKEKKKSFDEVKKSLQAERLVRIGEVRQITTDAKVEAAIEIIQNIIDSEEKIVVFSSYNEPLEKLYEKFKDISVLILGYTPSLLRQKMIENFQNKSNIKIFFGGIACAGMGINLTASSNILFLNLPWVPAEKEQCIDRCHRIGSKAESINVYNLYIPNTIDDYMRKILNEKQKIFDALFEKPTERVKSLSVIDDIIKEIQNDI